MQNLLDHHVTHEAAENPDPAATHQGLAILAAITALGENLTRAEAMIAEGYGLDLAGLDGEISRVCASATQAPAALKPALRRALAGLLAKLDRLQSALTQPPAPSP